MEIGIGKLTNKEVYFTANKKVFKEKFHTHMYAVPNERMYSAMYDIASWVNNELNEECFFYMD